MDKSGIHHLVVKNSDMNSYYKYEKHLSGNEGMNLDKAIELEATGPDDKNGIVLTLTTTYETGGKIICPMTLTEQEQDDLIRGILERRGLEARFKRKDMDEDDIIFAKRIKSRILSDNEEQSAIHPYKK